MQAVALVTGDEFLVQFNLTIDAVNMDDFLYELTWKWEKDINQRIGFDDFYGARFRQILSFSGMCFTFNVAAIEEILNLEK
jgi:hypothetical protein